MLERALLFVVASLNHPLQKNCSTTAEKAKTHNACRLIMSKKARYLLKFFQNSLKARKWFKLRHNI